MSDLIITVSPATGSSVVCGDGPVRSIKAVAFVTLEGDEARRTFTSTDTEGKVSTFRLVQVTVYDDGTTWCWAAQMTKAGHPYKNGMGLTLGSSIDNYGPEVAAVLAEAVAKVETERKLDELAARGQAILDDKGQTVDEYWDAKATTARMDPRIVNTNGPIIAALSPAGQIARVIASAVPQPDGKGGLWVAVHSPSCAGEHNISEACQG
jgi:hypothetical protein